MSWHVLRPVANGKSAILDAELPLVSEVFDDTSFLDVVELLMLVFLNPFIEVAWDGWEVMESWLVNSVLILARDDQWSTFLFSGLRVEVHASSRLHTGSHWLW